MLPVTRKKKGIGLNTVKIGKSNGFDQDKDIKFLQRQGACPQHHC